MGRRGNRAWWIHLQQEQPGEAEHRQQSKALELSSSSSELLGSKAGSPSLWINPVLSLPPAHNLPPALFPSVRKIPYTSAVKALTGQF